MDTPNFIGVYDDIVYESFCQEMIDEYERVYDQASVVSHGEVANDGVRNRRDCALFFERDSPEMARQVNVFLDTAMQRYAKEHPSIAMCSLSSNVIKVQKTPPRGGFHLWHSEQGSGVNSARALTWILYLNDVPEDEGTTEFLEFGIKMKPKAGRLLIWPAGWTHTHRGNPVYTVDKYIATGWYYMNDHY